MPVQGCLPRHHPRTDDLRELTHAQPLHHARPVDLDRAHADPEIVSDQLVRPACQQPIKNLPLARTESCESPDGVGDIVVAIVLVPSLANATSIDSSKASRTAV